MTDKASDTINLLLQLGKIGTRVQILKENGELHADQLFFKSLSQRKITWSDDRKSILISPYVLVLDGKITGLLSIAPSVNHIPDQLCLGIVSKQHVIELIFQNSRDRTIWSRGLQILVSGPNLHFVKSPTRRKEESSSQYYLDHDININHSKQLNHWNGNDIIQWHEISMYEKQKIESFYSFLSNSYKGAVFYQYQTKKLKLPQKVLVKLDMNGDKLICIDQNNNIQLEIPFDAEIIIIDSKEDQNKNNINNDEQKQENINNDISKSKDSLSSVICDDNIGDRENEKEEQEQEQEQEDDINYTDNRKPNKLRSKLQHFRHAPSSLHCFSIIRKEQSLHIGCHDNEQYLVWRHGLEYLSSSINHLIRMKVRRAILAGDLILSPTKQLIIESPSRQKQKYHHQKKNSSSTKSYSFWGLFG